MVIVTGPRRRKCRTPQCGHPPPAAPGTYRPPVAATRRAMGAIVRAIVLAPWPRGVARRAAGT
ncbi:hypothetical protein, partial [Burkholderia ubonensis]|uniref:hypothetical protein n=1 Tax=Burkholderia ubonensis TaxID=101571 RepID=UPI001C4324A9